MSRGAMLPVPLFSVIDAPSNGQGEGPLTLGPCTRLQPFPKVPHTAKQPHGVVLMDKMLTTKLQTGYRRR